MSGPRSLLEALERAAAGDRGGVRFVDRHEREEFHGWPRLAARAQATAVALLDAGLEPGQPVAMLLGTGPEFVATFFGILEAGGIPAPLPPPARLARLDEYRAHLEPLRRAGAWPLAVADRRVQALLGPSAADDERLVAVEDLAVSAASGAGGSSPRRPPGPGDLALLQFSSGTTDEAKPIALSHRALLAQVERLHAMWPPAPGETLRGVSWLPLHHDMGLVGFLLGAVCGGAELTLLAPETFAGNPAAWLRAIARHEARISGAPSFAYDLTARRVRDEDLEGLRLDAWTVALNGAEAVSGAVMRRFTERFRPWGFAARAMTPVYGLAEAALAVTFSALDEPPRTISLSRRALEADRAARPSAPGEAAVELASLGRPLPDMAVAVRDERGAPLPPGAVGRIWVRSPSLMDGYWRRADLTARALRDGWLDTGDLGFLDAERRELFLVSRAKDLLIVRGRNVAPTLVEEAAATVPDVRADGVVAVSDAADPGADGERLHLFVEVARPAILRQDDAVRALVAAVRSAVLSRCGLAVTDVHAMPSGSLPRTTSGKLRRAETLRRHRAGEWPERVRVALPLAARVSR